MKQLQDFRDEGWPESVNTKPGGMSMNEQAMIEGLRGEAVLLLKQYARAGYYDDGCGKHWISDEGRALAKRRLAEIDAHQAKWRIALPANEIGPDRHKWSMRFGD